MINRGLSLKIASEIPTKRYFKYQTGYLNSSDLPTRSLLRKFIDSVDESLSTIKPILGETDTTIERLAALRQDLKVIYNVVEEALDNVNKTILSYGKPSNEHATRSDGLWSIHGLSSHQSSRLHEFENLQVELERALQNTTGRIDSLDNFQSNVLENILEKIVGIRHGLVSALDEARQFVGQEWNNKRRGDVIDASYQWRRSLLVLSKLLKSKEAEMVRSRWSR